jgi:hypothetical protein
VEEPSRPLADERAVLRPRALAGDVRVPHRVGRPVRLRSLARPAAPPPLALEDEVVAVPGLVDPCVVEAVGRRPVVRSPGY